MDKDHPKPHQVPPSQTGLKQPRKFLCSKNQPRPTEGLPLICVWWWPQNSRKYHQKQFITDKRNMGEWMGWERECAATPRDETMPWQKDPSCPPGTISPHKPQEKIKFINVNVVFVKARSVFAVTRVGGKQIHLSIRSLWDSSDIKERRIPTLSPSEFVAGIRFDPLSLLLWSLGGGSKVTESLEKLIFSTIVMLICTKVVRK